MVVLSIWSFFLFYGGMEYEEVFKRRYFFVKNHCVIICHFFVNSLMA